MTLLRCAAILSLLVVMASTAFAQSLFVAYPCQHQPAEAMAKLLQPHLSQRSDAQLVIDSQGKRVLVSGPAKTYNQRSSWAGPLFVFAAETGWRLTC